VIATGWVDMRVLITGARGFVGPYVAEALRRKFGANVRLIPTAKEAGEHPLFGPVEALDVTDGAAVTAAVAHHIPTHVIHLAGIASPAAASADPQMSWRVHVQGPINLAQAVLDKAPNCWLLHAGSGLVYGESAKQGLPLNEETLLSPVDEYSVTKAAADLAIGALTRQGLKSIRFRPFNHTGPGQTDAFVVPAFARQIARIEAGLSPPVVRVGNLDAERDFLDVRDVANAYALAVQTSETLHPGMILNIASGMPRRMEDILMWLLAQSSVRITIERDPERLRSSDLPRVVGDASRARARLGWVPEHAFEDTLKLVLNDARIQIQGRSTQEA
jgi:GDP-4-dehydro-6-deoxy-D-mannose reductase